MKEKHKILLRVAIFSVIILITLVGLNKFFRPAFFGWNIYYATSGFYEEPEDTIETLFLGSSVGSRGIIPTELYEDYGMCSYNLSIANGPMFISYYWLEEAYRYQSETLKTVVLDVSQLRSESGAGTYHKSLDAMKMSKVKWKAIKDYAGDDYLEMASFVFPLIYYHDRWKEIGESDFQKYTEDPVNGTRGYHFVTFKNAVNLLEEENAAEKKQTPLRVFNPELNESAATQELVEDSMYYFEKIVDFCEEKDLELVLLKVPTRRWNSSLHNSIAELAEEHGLKYVDYNFSPLYEETGIVYSYDSSDNNHLNYFGASKFTNALGKYLVENCEVTDVRGDEKYAFMEEQVEKYRQSVRNEVSLETAETVEEYLANALQNDNTIMLSVKNSAALALTEVQREYFSEIGLEKLSQIKYRDSYIGVIENGKVLYEELKLDSTQEEDLGKAISYKGALENGLVYEIKSGGYNQGAVASCKIDGELYSVEEEDGLHITVYNNYMEKVVDYTAFQTDSSRSRECYASKTCDKIVAGTLTVPHDSESLYSNVQEYIGRTKDLEYANAIRKEMGSNDIFTFLNKYWNDDNKMILIAAKDDASKALSDEDRREFFEMGLTKLSELSYKNSYLAYIDGGTVAYEMRSDDNTPVVLDELGIYLKSAGGYAGSIASIRINGKEYSKNAQGFNVVVYDKELKRVVDQEVFNTFKNEIVKK